MRFAFVDALRFAHDRRHKGARGTRRSSFSTEGQIDKMGDKGIDTTQPVFEGHKVSADQILGGEPRQGRTAGMNCALPAHEKGESLEQVTRHDHPSA